MIFKAIDVIQKQLNAAVPCVVGNVGELLAGASHASDNNIIISLINIEENRISRDPLNFMRNGSEIIHKNPAVNLHLTLLFTSIAHDTGYEIALQNIQRVVEFFQRKYVFDHGNTPLLDPLIEKLILEMLSYNIEQLHQLWSMLGGRYHPSVAYRLRMVTIDSVEGSSGPLIREVESNFYLKE